MRQEGGATHMTPFAPELSLLWDDLVKGRHPEAPRFLQRGEGSSVQLHFTLPSQSPPHGAIRNPASNAAAGRSGSSAGWRRHFP